MSTLLKIESPLDLWAFGLGMFCAGVIAGFVLTAVLYAIEAWADDLYRRRP